MWILIYLCKKFINNVGLKPLYFWGNKQTLSVLLPWDLLFLIHLGPGHNENVRYDKELTEYVMIRRRFYSSSWSGLSAILSTLFQRRYRTEIWLQQTQHPASVPNFMHVPLGEYIRKRRLCRAAILSGSPRNLCLILHSLCILITAVIQPRI